jgi:RNA polymerase sigma-70 factor, ECF subfamily
MVSDEHLESDRQNQDEEFVQLLGAYRRQLFRFIYSVVHSMHDAEDLFQQVTITLWDKFDEFEPGTDFFSWACSIAKFKALNYFKAKGRQRLHFSPELIDEIAKRESMRPDVHDARLRALAECRRKLANRDQTLLAACYGGSESILEAAQQLGRTPGSVYDSLSRIRRALRTCIQRTLAQEGQR